MCLYGDDEKLCCSPDSYAPSETEPIRFIREFCKQPQSAKVFKLLWTRDFAQISHISISVESNLVTLEGAELLAKAKMIGGAHASGLFNFNKAFDSNKKRDENSLYHSLGASAGNPQGVQITFDTPTQVHEVTLEPRGMASTWDR